MRIDDFEIATRLTPSGDGAWSAELREDWGLWGPSGGYLSSLALRAAGEFSRFKRPASFQCQFLRVGKFAPVVLKAELIKDGRRSQLIRVDIIQDERALLTSSVWGVEESLAGLEHDDHCYSSLPDPETLPTWEDIFPDEPPFDFVSRIDQRPILTMPRAGDRPREAELTGFYRFKERHTYPDPFIDAARIMILLDTFGWLAHYPAHPSDGPSAWIAPNMDYYYRFFRPSNQADWLHMCVKAGLAHNGLMGTDGEIRDRNGYLLAAGNSQLICLPRPRS